MDTRKFRDRSKSFAEKTLEAVEAVECRIGSGECGAAITSAIEQLRSAVESLGVLPAMFLEDQTKELTGHLDERVRQIEQLVDNKNRLVLAALNAAPCSE